MGELSPWHVLIVVAAFILLFGANKLPQMARSVGQSMRIFKAETRALSGEREPEHSPPSASSPSPSSHQAPPVQAPPGQPRLHEQPPSS
jgi:sec-independent protein translocase protein TatA